MMVWPALAPPWKRTTTSEVSASRSVILPLPSSPQLAPTIAFTISNTSAAGIRSQLRAGLPYPSDGFIIIDFTPVRKPFSPFFRFSLYFHKAAC